MVEGVLVRVGAGAFSSGFALAALAQLPEFPSGGRSLHLSPFPAGENR